MSFFNVKELPRKEIRPGIWLRSAFIENVMLTYVEFEPNKEISSHKHPHEQITFVLKGELEFQLGEKTRVLKAGEGVTVPPNTEHSASALTQVEVVDAWHPIREDYIVT